ncbi:MAG TPA: SDR family NAD(P)-dependent oxidoreductase [Roseococcus sp.]|nr:SDR family NAD(P)-dependent oxidoreductase [Roseococcus sp.]
MTEPVAILGLACRFPGAEGPEAFWRLLEEGRDAITRIPPDRWDADALHDPDPDAPRGIVTREGGFLDGMDLFDAALFGLSPREAAAMDPQHRILLELAWAALEDAGLRPDRAGHGGVFLGIASNNYAQLAAAAGPPDAYSGLGAALSAAPGRVAYSLGLTGPALALDAACASSLAAVHLACQALRQGECDIALAGGVNAILTPFGHEFLSRARVLSPDGRCRAFGAGANGIGRAEGAGIIVLKRLADAERDGDRVLAVVAGSAVEQDGRSSGLTVPNGLAQARLIRAALSRAGIAPAAVDVIEAHGTGTPLGDPIEAEALGEVFGPGRDRPLLVGSVKGNIAHAEAAAGIAGLIKLVLALRAGCVPPTLHADPPNPRLAWGALRAELPARAVPWPPGPGPRTGGVSAFGLTGTIAHVLLREAPPRPAAAPPPPPLLVLPLSARSAAGLEALRQAHLDALARLPEAEAADWCFTAATGRRPFPHRLCAVAPDLAALREALAKAEAVEVPAAPPPVALVCTGARLPAATRAALATHPAARAVLAEAAPLIPAGPAGEAAMRLAAEVAAGALWRALGVARAVGEGAGAAAAAVLAGALPLAEALRGASAPASAPPPGHLLLPAGTPPAEGLALLFRAGHDPRWEGLAWGRRQRLGLPITPFERQRHWLAPPAPALAPALSPALASDTLPGRVTALPDGGHAFTLDLAPGGTPWLDQHRLRGEAVLPAAGAVALLLAAARAAGQGGAALAGLRLITPLRFPDEAAREVATQVTPDAPPRLLLASRAPGEAGWTRHAEAALHPPGTLPDLPAFPYPPPLPPARFEAAAAQGVGLGPLYRGLLALGEVEGGMAGLVALPEDGTLGPPVLDACFQVAAAALPEAGAVLVPASLARAVLPPTARGPLRVLARPAGTEGFDLLLGDAAGRCVGMLEGLRFRPLPGGPGLAPLVPAWEEIAPPVALARAGQFWEAPAAAPEALPALLAELAARAGAARAEPPLWIVTRDAAHDPVQAALWGAAAALPHEMGEGWGGILDLPPGAPLPEAPPPGEERRLRRLADGALQALRLRRAAPPGPRAENWGTVLVTGGLGGIGRDLLAALAARGTTRLLLLNRRAAPLPEPGIPVEAELADLADPAQLEAALARFAARGLVPDAVVHLAGVPDGALLARQTQARLAEITAAKALGAWHLHRLTRQLPIRRFVMFSSLSATLGVPGQAAYGAANAFLEGLARRRRAEGLPALAIAWGAWEGAGMAQALDGRVQAMPRAEAFAAGLALAEDPAAGPVALLAALDWAAHAAALPAERALLSHLLPARGPVAAPAPASGDLATRLAAAGSRAARHRLLRDALAAMAATLLQGPAPPPGRSLFDAGFDSLMAMDLAEAAGQALGRELPATLLYDAPSLDALAEALLGPEAPAAVEEEDLARILTLSDAEIAAELEARFGAEPGHG